MFKGFSNKQSFNGFPERIFGQNSRSAYGFNGVNLWLDASNGIPNQTNLAAVPSWTDLATGNEFLQQTAGNQPRWIASDARYNNLPVVQGVDSARRMLSRVVYSNFKTIALVANYDIINSGNVVLGWSPAQSHFIILGGTFGGYNGVGSRNPVNTMAAGTTENTAVKIGVLSKNGVWVNGVKEYTGDTYIGSLSYDTVLGSSNVNSYGLIGSLAELIGWSQDHDEMAISGALNQKYAIY